jgi:hypothetical protein
VGGSRSEALLNEMNPESGYLRILFGSRAETVSFSKLRRLTLTTPLTAVDSIGSSAPAEVDREYRLKSTEVGCPPMIGRTLGYVRAREGHVSLHANRERKRPSSSVCSPFGLLGSSVRPVC